MSTKPKVVFSNVSKKFTLKKKKSFKLLDVLSSKECNKDFYALRNISFSVNEGETIGIIGINGSGKSTLSNLLAQIVPPTTGEIYINGETSLIAISVGLNNSLTGLENIRLKCLMQGMPNEEIKKITPKIIEFAELEEFIHQPVKNYSRGMKSRLGFAITAHADPDIMVIDEALSVGDQTFYEKCINKMNEFKKVGKTIFFISHSIGQVRSFCDKAMWIHFGELVEFGDTKQVTNNYNKFIKFFNSLSEEEKKNYKKEKMALQKMPGVNETQEIGPRFRKPKRTKPNYKNFLQFALLLALFVFSTYLMLFNIKIVEGDGLKKESVAAKPETQIEKKVSKAETVKEQNAVDEKVNQMGYIISDKEPIYKTRTLGATLDSLNFSDEVYVSLKTGNLYEIVVNKKQAFVHQENIYIPKTPLVKQDFNISEFLSGFPDQFVSSNQYYIALLNSDQNKLESMLRGKTGETTDEYGNKYIVFNKVKYRLAQNKLSDRLIVSDFNQQKIDMNKLIGKATFKSKDNQIIYILSKTNAFIFNFKENTVTITENPSV